MPPVNDLRRSDDGSLVCGLEEADWSQLLETGWQTPERFVAKARDGETDIYGIILRPANFDPELFREHETDLVQTFNALNPDEVVTLQRRRGLFGRGTP